MTADAPERVMLSSAFSRLDPLALAIALGSASGVGLAIATAVLLLQGGKWIGMHLWRLAFYLPGYEVSWAGTFVGLVEGAVLGALVGATIALVWNGYHRLFVALVLLRASAADRRRELQGL